MGPYVLHVGSTVPGTLAVALSRSWTYLGISLDPFPTGSIAMYLLSWLSPASAIEGQRWACVQQISRLKNNLDRALEDWERPDMYGPMANTLGQLARRLE